ncbi:MAG: hypothetical protein AMJ78_02495 [Omnitrophica WOR_2 bacterium SM23_29]|nr:MAG: hypothetical protein AMJ78_02495 [Omnitrophica WOR_2 bacterium SM23_29]
MLFNLTTQEKKVLIVLSIFAILGLTVSGYRNYIARPQIEVVPTQLKSAEADYQVLFKQRRTVNINIADANELEILPNIGPALAKRIVDYRNAHGRFLFKEDLMKVKGIGHNKFDEIKEYICLE